MDWSTSDPTQTYADTLFVPAPDHDAGVYLLDPAERPEEFPEQTGIAYGRTAGPYGSSVRHGDRGTAWDEARARNPRYAPNFPNERSLRDRPAHVGYANTRAALVNTAGGPDWAVAGKRSGVREGYYTGGNIISESRDRGPIYDVTWDERPQRYNPNTGADWARLIPSPRLRPYGGGPAPSLAFPMTSQSEGLNRPDQQVFPSPASSRDAAVDWMRDVGGSGREGMAPSPEGFTAGTLAAAISARQLVRVIEFVLLIVIIVLLTMTLCEMRRCGPPRGEPHRGDGGQLLRGPAS